MRHRLEKYPNDFAAHMNLGALMLSRLDAQDAVSVLRAAVRIDPSLSSCARRARRGFGEFGATSGRYPSVSVGASGEAGLPQRTIQSRSGVGEAWPFPRSGGAAFAWLSQSTQVMPDCRISSERY
jgi:hypothetical protein